VPDGTQATVWVWRSGREEERDEWAIENGVAGGGWRWLPSMLDIQTREALREIYRASRPESEAQGEARHVGQLANIRFDVAVGDLVIMPRTRKGLLALGRVIGPYEYRGSEPDVTRRHLARVDWSVPDFPRAELADDLSNILNRRGTIFRPRASDAQARLQQLIETGIDPGSTSAPDPARGRRSFLLTWNPKLVTESSHWHTDGRWSSRNQQPSIGDQVYLFRQHTDRGIVRSGQVTQASFLDTHWDPERAARGDETSYLGVKWTSELYSSAPLPIDLLQDQIPEVQWNHQYSSGNQIPASAVARLEELWADRESAQTHRRNEPARDPKWTLEEQILAFRLFREKYPQGAHEARVIEVSEQLQALTIHPQGVRTKKFRNPNGVSRKLGVIATHAPDYEGKRTTSSRLDRDAWDVLGPLSDEELLDLVDQVLAGKRVFLTPSNASSRGAGSARRELVIRGGFTFGTSRQRRGQRQFRDQLLVLGGPHCLVTGDDGPLPRQALDACHLYSYAKTGEHLPRGGALMRRDLHTLFDLSLLAIEPRSWTVYLAPSLRDVHAYKHLHERRAATVWRDHLDEDLLLKRLEDADIDLSTDTWPVVTDHH